MLKRISFVAAVVTAALATSPALAASGPVGVWKLDEGSGTAIADSSGNGNDGVMSGAVSWGTGVFGPALVFDGANGQVKVSDNLALEPKTAVTVSAWVKGGDSSGAFRYVLAKGANGCVAASYGLYTGPRGGLEFYVSQGHGSVYAQSPDPGQAVWDGKWHLAVGTYDGTTIRLYVDGVQVRTGTPWTGSLEYLLPNSNDFYIGNYPGCADHEFDGSIDDVQVWNRTLSASEISALGTSTGGTSGQPTSPSGGGGVGSGSTGGIGSTAGTGGTGGSGGSGGGSTGTGGSTKGSGPTPSVSGVRLSNPVLTVDMRGHVISHSASGLSLTYVESEAASITLTLLRSERGVIHSKRCVAPSRHVKGRSCTRFVVVSSVSHTGKAGRLTVALSQLFHLKLTPGTYRLDLTPRSNGKVGKTVSVRLVVRRSAAHA